MNLVKNIIIASVFVSPSIMAQINLDAQQYDCMLEPSQISDVGSSVPGVLKSISIERGQTIEKGSVIAKLESSVEEKALLLKSYRAKSEVATDLHRLMSEFGDRTNKRNSVLASTSAISEQDLDQIQTDSNIAKMRLEQERENQHLAKLEYDQAKAIVERKTIVSPLTGVVMDRFKSVGEFIDESPVARVAQLDPLHVQTILPVELMGKLFVGQKASIGLSVDDYEPNYEASISLVDRVADAPSSTFSVRLALSNEDFSIPAGVRCRISFHQERTAPDYIAESKSTGSNTSGRKNNNRESSEPEKQLSSAGNKDRQELAKATANKAEIKVSNTDSRAPQEISRVASSASLDSPKDIDPNCFQFGPFVNDRRLNSVEKKLLDAGIVSTREVSNSEGQYMVLSGSDEMTALDLKRFKRQGVEDLYLMAKGKYSGRISFGLFGKRKTAEFRKKILDSKSIPTQIVPRTKNKIFMKAISTSDSQSEFILQVVGELRSHKKIKIESCDK